MKERWAIVSTSLNKTYQKKAQNYLWVTITLFLIVILYEHFSHGVSSVFMKASILFPLFGGCLLSLVIPSFETPGKIEAALYRMALSTLTIGFFLYGVFEIYGSIESLVVIYFYLGGFLTLLAVMLYLRTLQKSVA